MNITYECGKCLAQFPTELELDKHIDLTNHLTGVDRLELSPFQTWHLFMCAICQAKALDIDSRVPHFLDVVKRKQPEASQAWKDNGPQLVLACHEYREYVDEVHGR